MVYKAEVEMDPEQAAILGLIRPSGTLYKVRLNGKDAGHILRRPWELLLPSPTQSGPAAIEIEVVSSLQNSWGPLHEKEGDDNMWVGPNAFENDGELREQINLYNYGLLGGAEVVMLS